MSENNDADDGLPDSPFETIDSDGGGFDGDAGELGTAESGGRARNLKDMALSTKPSRSLDEIESPWDPDRGGWTRLMRAFQKATDVEGLPAILDGIIAIPEIWVGHTGPVDLGNDGDGDSEQDTDGTGEPVQPPELGSD